MFNIGIIDYGAGNLMSVQNTLDFLGFQSKIISTVEEIENSKALILPGVGAFPHAMKALNDSGLKEAVIKAAKTKPFMGICLGMQLLFDKSYEVEECDGLGILKGEIIKIPTNLKLPQMGWNELIMRKDCVLTKNIKPSDYVYFVHSFMASPKDPSILAATCEYGTEVPAMIEQGNVFACQFHPEKSGDVGLVIMKSFAEFAQNFTGNQKG